MKARMEAAIQAVKNRIGNDESREFHVARALLMGYEARWGDSTWTAVGVEESFEMPIVSPYNLSEHQYKMVGMLDTRVKGYGYENVMMEHKTTKADFNRPDTHYFDKLSHDQQLSIYSLSAIASGKPLDGIIYDVIRRPSIRPKKLPRGTRAEGVSPERGSLAEILSFGSYWGLECSEAACEQAEAAEEDKKSIQETAELFGLRVLYNCLEFPDNYYHRTDMIRRREEYLLDEVVPALWHIAEDIAGARKEDKLAKFYQNSGSCYSFSTPCEFLSLCQGVSDCDDEHEWEARRGGSVSGDGRLSTSSISCWMLCHRKYFYRYVKKIQRRGRIEPVATSLGSVIHAGLESWWSLSNEHDSNRESTRPDQDGSGRKA